MIEPVLVIMLLFTSVRITWSVGQRMDRDNWIAYLRQKPNAYRLWDHLLLFFHERPFSIITLESLSWGVSVVITYLILMPSDVSLLVFLLVSFSVAAGFHIRANVMYPVLAALVVTGSPVFLVILILIKEHTAFIGVGYLLLHGGLTYSLVIWAIIAGFVYIILRVYIVAEEREGAPLFTPRYAYDWLRGRSDRSRMLLVWGIVPVAVTVLFGLVISPLLLVWSIVPILLFALWWEPQLWLPIVVVLLGV